MSPELLQFDAIDAFHELLSKDHILEDIKGLSIHKVIEETVMGTTEPAGNRRVLISKDGEAVAEAVIGGTMILYRERIQIETYVKTVKGEANARDAAKEIWQRIRTVLSDAEWLNKGWLSHTEVFEGWPSPPTSTEAVHRLTYEVLSGIEAIEEG